MSIDQLIGYLDQSIDLEKKDGPDSEYDMGRLDAYTELLTYIRTH
jgi:hypothetical protein